MCFLQVNPQLYSTREKQQLYDLIDTMINYNLTYRQDRTPEGQYTNVLEPWVHAHTQTTLPWSTDILFCWHLSYATQTSSQEYTITHTALRDSVCVYLFITIYERLGCVSRLLSLPPLLFPFVNFLRPLFHFGDSLRWELGGFCYLPHAWMHMFITQVFKKTYNPLCGLLCPTTHTDWWEWCWQCSQTSFDSHVWSTCCWTFKSLLDGAKGG